MATGQPSLWDWVILVTLELPCLVLLVMPIFWLPLTDWLMRRRLRKQNEWRWKHHPVRKYETVGRSKFHGKN
jgi:hypothetical protein